LVCEQTQHMEEGSFAACLSRSLSLSFSFAISMHIDMHTVLGISIYIHVGGLGVEPFRVGPYVCVCVRMVWMPSEKSVRTSEWAPLFLFARRVFLLGELFCFPYEVCDLWDQLGPMGIKGNHVSPNETLWNRTKPIEPNRIQAQPRDTKWRKPKPSGTHRRPSESK
jgi:hypothetical protein